MKAYQPINCNFYDILEATAVKRKTVPIIILEDNIQKTIETKIIDLYANHLIFVGTPFVVINGATMLLFMARRRGGTK